MKVNLEKEMKKIKKPWTPIDVVKVNNQVVRLALFKGAYHWHSHKEDELFLVLRGKIRIETRGRKDIMLSKGEIVTISKGIVHRTSSEKGAYVLMFEPAKLKSRGD